jgi:hypothetical protein
VALYSKLMERPMSFSSASRSPAVLDQNSTMIAVIEMSQSKWLISAIVPGVERQPLKKLDPDEEALRKLLHRWRNEAGAIAAWSQSRRPTNEATWSLNRRGSSTKTRPSSPASAFVLFGRQLRKAEEKLDDLRTAEGAPLLVNTLAELRRHLARLPIVREQIHAIEQEACTSSRWPRLEGRRARYGAPRQPYARDCR